MIILDTNVVSEPLRPTPHASVVSWLDAQPIETMFLTAIGLAEMRFGIALLPTGRRRQQLHDRLEREVLPEFDGRVLSFDADASAAYAAARARARRQSAAINDLDALIAGIAASRGFAVATRDKAVFTAAGVPVIDPFEERGSP